jgi:hypothetical protein
MFMSDGGENGRRIREYMYRFSERLSDWFSHHHAVDGVQHQTKALQEERPEIGVEVSSDWRASSISCGAETPTKPLSGWATCNGVEFHSGPFEPRTQEQDRQAPCPRLFGALLIEYLDMQRLLRNTILITLVTFVPVIMNTPAKAAIGWSLEECKQHWGNPIKSTTRNGIPLFDFTYQEFQIAVLIENGKVICATYLKSGMTDQDLNEIRTDNGKEWTLLFRTENKQYWNTQDGIFCSIQFGNIDAVLICYQKDLKRL